MFSHIKQVEEFKVKFQSVAPEIRRNEAAEVEATMAELQSGIFDEKDGGWREYSETKKKPKSDEK